MNDKTYFFPLKGVEKIKIHGLNLFMRSNLIIAAASSLFILFFTVQLTLAGQTLPGDYITSFQVIKESYNPSQYWQWTLKLRVQYQYDYTHGQVSVGGNVAPIGNGLESGYNGANCLPFTVQSQQGKILIGSQEVNISVRLTADQYITNTMQLWIADQNGTFVHRNFSYSRTWKHSTQAARTGPPQIFSEVCLGVQSSGADQLTCVGQDGHCVGKGGCTFYDKDTIYIILRFKNLAPGQHTIFTEYFRYDQKAQGYVAQRPRLYQNFSFSNNRPVWTYYFRAAAKKGGSWKVMINLDQWQNLKQVDYDVNKALFE